MSEPANLRKFNGLVTYLEARRYVDAMFELTRKKVYEDVRAEFKRWYYAEAGNRELQGALTGEGANKDWSQFSSLEDLFLRRAMEVVNAEWREAIKAIQDVILPQRRKSSSRVSVRTVYRRNKTVPSLSQSARRARGEKKRSTKRSHVKGKYVPKLPPEKRGRPGLSRAWKLAKRAAAARESRAAAKQATAARRAEKGWKPYRRLHWSEAERGARGSAWHSEKNRKLLRGRTAKEVRAEMAAEKKDKPDNRHNHHPEYGYGAPKKRVRRTAAQVERWGYSKRKKGEKQVLTTGQILAQSAIRNALAARQRIEGARAYWVEVKRRMKERLSPKVMPLGRPLGSGDKAPRKRRVGGNAGSFGRRNQDEKNRKWSDWKERRKKIAAVFRRQLALVVWEEKRRGAYRNDPQAYAGTLYVLNRKKAALERTRALLAAHDAEKPKQ